MHPNWAGGGAVILFFIATAVLLFGWLGAVAVSKPSTLRTVINIVGIALTAWLGGMILAEYNIEHRADGSGNRTFTTVTSHMN